MGLESMLGTGRRWTVLACSAASGEGVQESLQWLLDQYREEQAEEKAKAAKK